MSASLNSTPSSERLHIGIFGRTNAGKSSIINAITGQNLAIVSEVSGTTTDPVNKAMELLPLGPVVFIDTPGVDDESKLGSQRVEKSYQVMNKVHMAIVVIDGVRGVSDEDNSIIDRLKAKGIPFVVVLNKADLVNDKFEIVDNYIRVSAVTGEGIHDLKETLAHLLPDNTPKQRLVADLVKPNDFVVLVVPIDKAAPKGRLILPQQQTIRDCLEAGAVPVVCRETELKQTLADIGKKPSLVITDSQAFGVVSKIVPDDIPMTSFSILFARYKGNLDGAVAAVRAISNLKDGDTVLISEGCTHHRQCDDIGTVKLPKWLKEFTGKDINFEFTGGGSFPDDLSKFKVVIHCGGCTLNEKEVQHRAKIAKTQGIPMTNYGIAIAYVNGIMQRALLPLGVEL